MNIDQVFMSFTSQVQTASARLARGGPLPEVHADLAQIWAAAARELVQALRENTDHPTFERLEGALVRVLGLLDESQEILAFCEIQKAWADARRSTLH